MRTLRSANGDPLLVLGDFNEVLCHSEKRGGMPRPERQIESFMAVVDDRGLRDLRSRGSPLPGVTVGKGNSASMKG